MIYVIINPYSRVNILHKNLSDILAKIVSKYGKVFVTRSLSEQDDIIKMASLQGVSTIAVCGGDGSVSQTLTSIYRNWTSGSYPSILFLKGGTINFLSSNLTLDKNPEQILRWYVDKLKDGSLFSYKTLDTLKIKDQLGFIYTDGVGVNFLKTFYSNKTNAFGSFLLLIKIFFSILLNLKSSSILKTKDLDYIYQDISSRTKSLDSKEPTFCRGSFKSMLFVSTVSKIAYGIKFFHLLGLNSECFEVSSFSFKKGPMFLLDLFRGFLKTSNKSKQIFISSKLSLLTRSSIDKYTYSLDGEILDCDLLDKVNDKNINKDTDKDLKEESESKSESNYYNNLTKVLDIALGPKFNFIVKK